MVKIIQKTVSAGKSLLLYWRCKYAITRADRQAITTGRKQLVIMYDGKPIVVSKQHLKRAIKSGAFRKGFTIENAEKMAIHKTL
ncbi:MAG: hypothetical protein RR015_03105 [Bacteroidales bacterium]